MNKWGEGLISSVISLSLLGIASLILGPVQQPAGDYEEPYIASRGLNRIAPLHHQEKLSFNQEDNYLNGPKNEEDPKYTTISVRPALSTYLDNKGGSVRLLAHYMVPGSDDVILMATKEAMFKSSGSTWQLLQGGLHDSPWENVFYADPNVSRMYLCNGIDQNKKYLSGQNLLFNMQNKDDEITISGNVWLTLNNSSATADATAIASLVAGRYIKSATTADDLKWLEITSMEGTTLKFSTPCLTNTGVYSSVVRSNNLDNSRHMIEYEGHIITGYTTTEYTTTLTTTASTDTYATAMAYGVAQSFVAPSSTLSKLVLRIAQYSQTGTNGNILIKIKSSITGNVLAQMTYPIANLPLNLGSDIAFDFGSVALTTGATYVWSVERENSSASGFQIAGANPYAGGNAYSTYNPGGFNSSWNTGLTTIEVSPSADLTGTFPAGNFGVSIAAYMDLATPGVTYLSSPITGNLTSTYAGNFSGKNRKTSHQFYLDYGGISTEASNWDNVKLQLYKTGTGTGTIDAYKSLKDSSGNFYWNYSYWGGLGATLEGTDYTNVGSAQATAIAAEGWLTFEVTNIARTWTPNLANNYGLIISSEGTSGITFNADGATSNKPKWQLTTATGKTALSEDLYFQIISQRGNASTINYSRRNDPENTPTLNTFKIPGRVVGLAKSGGYLVVGGKDPDALYFYRYTGDVSDGYAFTDPSYTATGMTFGSTKSIAYLPKDAGFIFYSGLGVYHVLGTQVELKSGQIRDEAEKFANYRDPRDYYGGAADMMPQAAPLGTKDQYVLSVPNTASKNSYLYVYNWTEGTWCRWTNINATALLVRKSGGADEQLYLGFDTGQVYILNTSGSTTEAAILEWYMGGPDLSKEKYLTSVQLIGRKDNPLRSSILTLEVSSTDPTSTKYLTSTKTITISPKNNETDNGMIDTNEEDGGFWPNLTAREFKFRLTQTATEGAISWRMIKFKYKVK